MPQTLIVIFLLFFAVLAFGWFYWQRAKARTAPPASVDVSPGRARPGGRPGQLTGAGLTERRIIAP